MMLLLAFFESQKLILVKEPLLKFGRMPLFFYLIHLPLIHGTALSVTYFRGLQVDWLVGHGSHAFPTIPAPEYGFNLPTFYGIWMVMPLLLYPLCTIFAKYTLHHLEMRLLSYI
jgi:hypothetical protein